MIGEAQEEVANPLAAERRDEAPGPRLRGQGGELAARLEGSGETRGGDEAFS